MNQTIKSKDQIILEIQEDKGKYDNVKSKLINYF